MTYFDRWCHCFIACSSHRYTIITLDCKVRTVACALGTGFDTPLLLRHWTANLCKWANNVLSAKASTPLFIIRGWSAWWARARDWPRKIIQVRCAIISGMRRVFPDPCTRISSQGKEDRLAALLRITRKLMNIFAVQWNTAPPLHDGRVWLQRCELPLACTGPRVFRRCTRLCSLARYPSSDRKDCAFGIRHSAHVCMSLRRMCIRMQNPSWWHANVCGVSNSECTILSSDPKDCAFGIRHSAHIWMLSRRMCIRMQNPSWRRADVCGVSNSECTILQIGANVATLGSES